MKFPAALALLLVAIAFASCTSSATRSGADASGLIRSGERSVFRNLRQLTFGGENAEGYFSFDERRFVFQRTLPSAGDSCDQIYSYDLSTGATRRISNGEGRTTCAYYLPGDSLILYATTHRAGKPCPPTPDRSQGYVWPIYPSFDIVVADTAGREVRWLTSSPGYDAEATVSPVGDRIVFTSTRSGDLELYSMNIDGSDVVQLTDVPGYDGGAFFSWDGKKIVFRASRHEGDDLARYNELLAKHLVRPSKMELYVMNADGSGLRQLTRNGAANFAPFWHPDGRHIIFASNVNDPKGRNFDLYLIEEDGSNMRQLTYEESFDGFPMFTRDGRSLIFASNRGGTREGETNLFIVDVTLPN